MKTILAVIGISLSILLSGCQSTSAALGKKVPEEYIEIISDESPAEVAAALEASGQDYVCKEIFYGNGSSKNRKACFIKAPEDKSLYKTLGIKLQDVPEALLQDTGKNTLIVGQVAVEMFLQFPWLFLN
jgi:hypothetical protein